MIEIERKFLVANDQWRTAAGRGVRYRQGYLAKTALATIRVRRAGDEACLTVKSARRGLERDELTCPVAPAEAEDMLARLCGGRVLEKVRHTVEHQGSIWVVDLHLGPAQGLVVAEIELERPDQAFAVPPWLGAEISHDPRYRNSAIALWKTPGDGPAPPARPATARSRGASRRARAARDAGPGGLQPAI